MSDPATDPAWRWPEDQWRSAIGRVRAGRALRPKKWKGGARLAVALSVELDHETLELARGGTSPAGFAEGHYGARQGTARLLRVLRKHNVPATFFTPAVSALLHPDEIKAVVAGGHEIALHGWCHEASAGMDGDEERNLIAGARHALEKIMGVSPVGHRAASGDFSAHTLAILRDLGILYDATFAADDDAYELTGNGEASGIVEIPASPLRNDATYFGGPTLLAPDSVFEIFRRELESAYDEGGLFAPVFHPHLIGQRGRIWIVDELLKIARSLPGVWFASHTDVALWVKSRAPG
jgi:peptidoglycan/xylan/chitin deacetylase (PgdA/CDA1 family)